MPLHLEGRSEEQQMPQELQDGPSSNVPACWRHAMNRGRQKASWKTHGGPPHVVFTLFISPSSLYLASICLPPLGFPYQSALWTFLSPQVLSRFLPECHYTRREQMPGTHHSLSNGSDNKLLAVRKAHGFLTPGWSDLTSPLL